MTFFLLFWSSILLGWPQCSRSATGVASYHNCALDDFMMFLNCVCNSFGAVTSFLLYSPAAWESSYITFVYRLFRWLLVTIMYSARASPSMVIMWITIVAIVLATRFWWGRSLYWELQAEKIIITYDWWKTARLLQISTTVTEAKSVHDFRLKFLAMLWIAELCMCMY